MSYMIPPFNCAVDSTLLLPICQLHPSQVHVLQVLVYHDLLGMMQHPHHAKVTPKFCKQFASVGTVVQEALQQYKAEVTSGAFPSEQYSPYKLPEAERHALLDQLDQAGFSKAAVAVADLTKSAGK